MSDESPADIVIYGSPVSPFVRKAMAACTEKQVPFHFEAINVFDPPEWFAEVSPMKRIPVMRDRSIAEEGKAGTIADSSAICGYIERKHPENTLYCEDPYSYGRALMLEEYADTTLAFEGGMGIFRPIFFNITQGKEPDLARAKETWAEKMPPILAFLESELDGRDFLIGNAVSIADISVATALMQLQFVANIPLDEYPALDALIRRMAARPSIAGPFAQAMGFVRKALPEAFDLT